MEQDATERENQLQPPQLLEYAAATTDAWGPWFIRLGFGLTVIVGIVLAVFGVASIGVSGFVISEELAIPTAGAGILVLTSTWLAFDRHCRSASIIVALIATISTVALLIWLPIVAWSYERWRDTFAFASYAVFLPAATGLSAYSHWYQARQLRHREAGKGDIRQ